MYQIFDFAFSHITHQNVFFSCFFIPPVPYHTSHNHSTSLHTTIAVPLTRQCFTTWRHSPNTHSSPVSYVLTFTPTSSLANWPWRGRLQYISKRQKLFTKRYHETTLKSQLYLSGTVHLCLMFVRLNVYSVLCKNCWANCNRCDGWN